MKAVNEPKVGRPRAFDRDVALNQALEVFWNLGYEGASLSDLTEAMGINRPSLYAAFGNKESLFREVLNRYYELSLPSILAALDHPQIAIALEQLLRTNVAQITNPLVPAGCLLIRGVPVCNSQTEPIHHDVIERRLGQEHVLSERLQRAQREGQLHESVDPLALARCIMTFSNGLSIQSINGVTQAELDQAADLFLQGLRGLLV
ncbi:MAG TPA: TetR/AcrR family transcriptional regulator [Herpetosiphon sp.]|uniref:Transcriptional regulator, TetR family n=1 Tax=Herpetosiphon aurantiacus (strain ATCC 23779 / DSM 785 / 114-95) TaxID=316274 RepID=A9B4H4_HERA2|nr:TetR/AcrR family transcriptional regulator [Herpetosiphon sp.]ABX04139.1 transcriptional regulator, TetR family [Herpetosiphon aurantiacus DSM 785]HBW48314.1 TetR/AcrR family transcriptional regulator [Herpetosiphon sp.]